MFLRRFFKPHAPPSIQQFWNLLQELVVVVVIFVGVVEVFVVGIFSAVVVVVVVVIISVAVFSSLSSYGCF